MKDQLSDEEFRAPFPGEVWLKAASRTHGPVSPVPSPRWASTSAPSSDWKGPLSFSTTVNKGSFCEQSIFCVLTSRSGQPPAIAAAQCHYSKREFLSFFFPLSKNTCFVFWKFRSVFDEIPELVSVVCFQLYVSNSRKSTQPSFRLWNSGFGPLLS